MITLLGFLLYLSEVIGIFSMFGLKTSILIHNTLISLFLTLLMPDIQTDIFLNYVSVPCNNYMLRDLPEPFSNLHYTMDLLSECV